MLWNWGRVGEALLQIINFLLPENLYVISKLARLKLERQKYIGAVAKWGKKKQLLSFILKEPKKHIVYTNM